MKYILFIFTLFLFTCSKTDTQTIVVEKKIENKVILALWDSLTAWYWVSENENYPSKLQKILDEKWYHYEIINAGVSWDTSANILSRASLYLEKKPEIVILVVWWNDWLRWISTKDLHKNIWNIIDTFSGSKIVLSGMQLPANLWEQYGNDFKKVYFDISDEKKNIYFHPFFLEWVAGKSELNIEDMIHPNEKWYEIIVKNLFQFLEKHTLINK